MLKRKNIVTMKGNKLTLLGNEIKKGDTAPEFTVLDETLSPRKLSEFAGFVKVISVFPSIDTSVCSAQMHRFNKEASVLKNVKIISVSNDLPFALKRFCGAEGINNLVVLSDYKDMDFGGKYGFVIEELRLLARGVIVVDKNNIVQHVEYVPEIVQEPNYEKALEVAKSIS